MAKKDQQANKSTPDTKQKTLTMRHESHQKTVQTHLLLALQKYWRKMFFAHGKNKHISTQTYSSLATEFN